MKVVKDRRWRIRRREKKRKEVGGVGKVRVKLALS
jgi:hypothetical protein